MGNLTGMMYESEMLSWGEYMLFQLTSVYDS